MPLSRRILRFIGAQTAVFAVCLSASVAYAYVPPGSGSAVDGVCGSSSGRLSLTTPAANLCSVGSASTVQGTGPWSWTCDGGGIVAVCSADVGTPVDGACGTSNGLAVTSTPAANLCAAGEASLVTDYTMAFKSHPEYWTWSCNGSGGGTVASCKATYGTPVNGACGSSNGQTLSSAPSTGLCSTGTASAVTDSSPWSWSCTGSGGGTTASCSASMSTDNQPIAPQVTVADQTKAVIKDVPFFPAGNAQGVSGAIYVAAIINNNILFLDSTGAWSPYVAGKAPTAYFTGKLAATTLNIIPSAMDLTAYKGAQILVGYGKGIAPLSDPFNNMLTNTTYDVIYTVQ